MQQWVGWLVYGAAMELYNLLWYI